MEELLIKFIIVPFAVIWTLKLLIKDFKNPQ